MPFFWLGLKLLGIGSKIKAGAKWCFATPARALVTALLLALAFSLFRLWRVDADRDKQRDAAVKWENAALAWENAFNTLVVKVEKGREIAAKLDAENATRVDREMQQIKKDTADDYDKALANTRSAADRLRRQLAAAAQGNQGRGGEAGMPDDYTARCQAFGYADCDALLTALPGLLEAAEGNTAKLIALQAWVKGILAVDLSGEPETVEVTP